jgi:hypothetical protein
VAPLAFTTQPLVGQGMALTPEGLRLYECLEQADVVTRGGQPQVELFRAQDSRVKGDARLRSFVESNEVRVHELARGRPPPLSFVITVHATGQWSELVESGARFRPAARKLIDARDWGGFVALCGSQVITGAAYDSLGVIFVTYLPQTPNEANEAEAVVNRRLSGRADDIFQLRLFDELPSGGIFHIGVRTDTDEPEPLVGKRVGEVVQRVVAATHDSGRGELIRIVSRPWWQFGAGRFFAPVAAAANRQAEPEVQGTTYAPLQLCLSGGPACSEELSLATGPFAELWEGRVPPSPMGQGQGLDRRGLSYGPTCLAAGEDEGAHLPADGDAPLVSAPPLPSAWSQSEWDDLSPDPPSKPAPDAGQPAPPSLAKPGAGLNAVPVLEEGLEGPTKQDDEASHEESPVTPREPEARGGAVTQVFHEVTPYGVRGWPWWRRLLFFWRRAPAPRQIYRGIIEVSGVSRKLPSDFTLSDEAETWAEQDRGTFFQRCGTHYLAQVEHRRGLVYYFSVGAPGDREISVRHYGLSNNVRSSRLLRPRTASEFLDNLSSAVDLLKEDDAAIPVRLGLEPWFGYLRSRGPAPPAEPR